MIRINLLAERRTRKGVAATPSGAAPTPGEGFKPIYLLYILLIVAALLVIGARWYMLTSEIKKLEAEQQELEEERNRLAEIIRKAKEFEAQKELVFL